MKDNRRARRLAAKNAKGGAVGRTNARKLLNFVKSTRSAAWKIERLNFSNVALCQALGFDLETVRKMRKREPLDKKIMSKFEEFVVNTVAKRLGLTD